MEQLTHEVILWPLPGVNKVLTVVVGHCDSPAWPFLLLLLLLLLIALMLLLLLLAATHRAPHVASWAAPGPC